MITISARSITFRFRHVGTNDDGDGNQLNTDDLDYAVSIVQLIRKTVDIEFGYAVSTVSVPIAR